eukprot:CAMPEP_0182856820 /NCGR_PEP_ID=MMETSP0034_2-20130328/2679_1 /TAXON_ID=156128 /ORGANISM="Nephroselmis pyriformis, Strain CCMP717" /LENGTH=87 /DNA_ID=CAMNT_0024987967 /DNA_START=139 /DNA_END=402 /DNA_ORIENTATION=+
MGEKRVRVGGWLVPNGRGWLELHLGGEARRVDHQHDVRARNVGVEVVGNAQEQLRVLGEVDEAVPLVGRREVWCPCGFKGRPDLSRH